MRLLGGGLATLAMASVLAACGNGSSTTTTGTSSGGHGGAGTGGAGTGGSTPACADAGPGAKGVAHVIVVVQENHTFDTYFGKWCTAPAGSNPTCTAGPACCEAAPATDPSGASPVALDDAANAGYDPNHQQVCEVSELDTGKMDRFVVNTDPAAIPGCADPRNFAIADAAAKPYHDLAAAGAVADRYFQPIAGQSSSNDMYLAVAKEVFLDNAVKPMATGSACDLTQQTAQYTGQKTIADVLQAAGKTFGVYAEGYAKVVESDPACPSAPPDCSFHLPVYPCIYTPSDVPFLYYAQHADDPKFMRDYATLATDLAAGTLPDVSFVKAIGYHTEHPGTGDTISDGTTFVTGLVKSVQDSCYKDSTLILVTWDEGGGYYDHVAPPPDSTVDMQPYGTRVPLLAIGRYAKTGTVSHTVMEHSSIVKFLELNYTGKTGQLMARDAVVNNIGSLLDEIQTGITIPDQ